MCTRGAFSSVHVYLIQLERTHVSLSRSLSVFRYASLYLVVAIEEDDNELITLDKLHLFVQTLDNYFGNVCELDIIFNFHRAYYILDEVFIGGELQDPNKRAALDAAYQGDAMAEKVPEFAPKSYHKK